MDNRSVKCSLIVLLLPMMLSMAVVGLFWKLLYDPSWGIMISNARLRLWQGVWWEMTFVTLAIFLIVLAFNLFGDALRDALDPRLRTSEK